MKMARIDDDIYALIVANAAKDGRTIYQYHNRLLAQALADNATLVYPPEPAVLTTTFPSTTTLSPKQHESLHAEVGIKPPQMGYACCMSKTKRCKHWEHNDLEAYWQNTLTGEVVDD